MLVKKVKIQGNLNTKQLEGIKAKLKTSDEASVVKLGVSSCDAVKVGFNCKNNANDNLEDIRRRVRRRCFKISYSKDY
ncbi:MAG: hypothetical protein K0R55_1958 [Sporomusa sp.]|jgi:hypothetical protein|nr:hypothetical protein [Sporomusa sp.]